MTTSIPNWSGIRGDNAHYERQSFLEMLIPFGLENHGRAIKIYLHQRLHTFYLHVKCRKVGLQNHAALLFPCNLFNSGGSFQDIEMCKNCCPIDLAVAIQVTHPPFNYELLLPCLHPKPKPASDAFFPHLTFISYYDAPKNLSAVVITFVAVFF